MKRVQLSLFALIAACLALSVGLSGCTRNKTAKIDNKTIVVALSSEPKTLDPRRATDAIGMRIGNLLFSSLVRLGPNLEIIGEAAESWTLDGNIYTFQLRPNLVFHNNRPVQAEDLLYSFEQYQANESPFQSVFSVITKVEARYDDEARFVKLHLKEYSATLLTDLSPLKILPKKEIVASPEQFTKQPIGTGPFSLSRGTNQDLTFKARRPHPYAEPKIETAIFKVVRDDNTRIQKLDKGELDIAQAEIPLEKVAHFDAQKNEFEVVRFPGLSMTYLLLNLKDPRLRKIETRKALAQALDIKEILTYKLRGLAEPASSILTPQNPFFASNLSLPQPDLAAAKELLSKLGLAGAELSLKTSNNQAAVDNARILAVQLEKAGIKVKLQSFEWGTFYSDISSGNFQLASMKWAGATDPDIYRVAFHSSEVPPGRNRGSYVNAKLDKLLEEGLRLRDESKRKDHYAEVQKIIAADLPMIPLWYETQVAIVRKEVKGYSAPLNGDFSFLLTAHK